MSVVIETTIGDLTVDLFIDERPVACLNFMKLCKLKYYNFNLFHTVEQGFIAQTGDPTGKGDGGCSLWGLLEGQRKRFVETESLPKIAHNSAGLLSLVCAGKNMVGSQFFFTLGSDLTSLDGAHCVIGEVVEGHETLRKLNEAIVDEKFRPYQDIRITHTVLLDDPFPDPRGFKVPTRSPSPSAERLQNGRIAADEDINDTDGKTMAEMQEMLAAREAKARATILEIVGDLPDADMAPPENVLFVCKLNPVTTDDDLEIIFSRFGKVKGCEVIRDKKTGDSLQYAFVEFEEQKSCEAAYFKMDNVLIDDRRIHVDFSQSVAKVKWRGKGRGIEGPEGRLDFNNLKDDGGWRQRGEGKRNGNQVARNDGRNRMTSEERKKARAERHRDQEEKRTRRSSSKNYDDRKRNEKDDDHRKNYVKEQKYRGRSPTEKQKRVERYESKRDERSESVERKRKHSPERRRSPKRRRSTERRSTERKRLTGRKRSTDRRRTPERRRSSDRKDLRERERSAEKTRWTEKRRSPGRKSSTDRKRERSTEKSRSRERRRSTERKRSAERRPAERRRSSERRQTSDRRTSRERMRSAERNRPTDRQLPDKRLSPERRIIKKNEYMKNASNNLSNQLRKNEKTKSTREATSKRTAKSSEDDNTSNSIESETDTSEQTTSSSSSSSNNWTRNKKRSKKSKRKSKRKAKKQKK